MEKGKVARLVRLLRLWARRGAVVFKSEYSEKGKCKSKWSCFHLCRRAGDNRKTLHLAPCCDVPCNEN